jgi:signal transduction histidine kinase
MSLRTRLILSFTLIVFLCLFIAAIAASVFLQGYREKTTVTKLEALTLPIYIEYRALAAGTTTLAEVRTKLQQEAERNNIYILLVDNNGNILWQFTPRPVSSNFNISKANIPHNITQPTSGIFTTINKQKFVYAAFPIARSETVGTLASQTLVLATPRAASLATIWAGLFVPFLVAGLIALAVSIALAVLLARSIYKPAQRLAQAADNVAHGNYDQEVPATGPKELKGLAVSFNEMSKKVKESQQYLRHFVADVSHQLKSPLTSIQGFAQAMLDGTADDTETKTKATQIIVDESKRMIRQVNELLELSRMQAGQVKMVKEPVDIKEVLTHCQEIFALRLQEKSLHLTNKIEPLMPVLGDVDWLEDVFGNLLDNAIKNTPPHGEIDITARTAGENIEVVISDSGPGIPPEQLPYVFQRFQTGAGLRSGTGLGLAIAREIVLAHKGKIEVTSSPGEGARFTVTLPTFRDNRI